MKPSKIIEEVLGTPAVQEDRRAVILEAAFRVFADEGYHKASIKTIAREAGLKSQALIYWYFKDKQELFEAVILHTSPVMTALPSLEGVMDEPPEKVLTLLGEAYLSMVDDERGRQLFKLFFQEVSRHPNLGESLSQHGFIRLKVFLVTYLKRQMKMGRLKNADPQIMGANFLGSLLVYCITKSLMPTLVEDMPEKHIYLKKTVHNFLEGLGQKEDSLTKLKSKPLKVVS